MGLLSSLAARAGFVSRRQAAAEARAGIDQVVRDYSLAWPAPMLFGLFGGTASNTGVPVTPISALQASAVFGCVNRLSLDMAKLPVVVERQRSDGGWERDRLHPFNNVLRRPNSWMTPFEFWRYMVTSLELRGNSIAVIKRGWDGSPQELIPLNWDRASVLLSPQGKLFYNVSHPQIGWGVTFAQEDVIHLRGMTIDGGYLGITPIAAAQDVVGLAIAAQQHGAVLFRQGAQIPGFIKHPGKLSKEAQERILQAVQNTHGGVQNAHKTAVLEEGMTYEKIGMTAGDSQFLESRAFQTIEICRIFGVPPHKVYDLSKANFSTLESQEQSYVNDSLIPRAKNIEDGTNDRVFFDDEAGERRVRFHFGELLRGDLKSRTEYYQSALMNGYLSANEVRALEGMPPIEGGDTYRVQVNMAPIAAQAGQPDNAAAKPAEPQETVIPPQQGNLGSLDTENADQIV